MWLLCGNDVQEYVITSTGQRSCPELEEILGGFEGCFFYLNFALKLVSDFKALLSLTWL